ncbi:MAG: hypothetical protein PUB14_09270 [Lachnospiraceae bacterium]|nr:hypothetical protein [Lachnospiraceae bacterium]
MDDFDDGLRKILLAGIGAAAATGEKAQKLFNNLAEKGAATVEQNKDLNERFQKKSAQAASAAKDAFQKMTETQRTRRDVAQTLAGMTDEELKQLKDALASLGFSHPSETAAADAEAPETQPEPQAEQKTETQPEEAPEAPQEKSEEAAPEDASQNAPEADPQPKEDSTEE